MSFMKRYLHALQEKQQEDSQLMYELMEKDAFEDEMFFNADKHHETQQAMMGEMDEPTIPSDIDPDYENFISNHPDGKYTPGN